MRRFVRIEGLSDARRLPRIGKIRLGIKVKSRDGKERPQEVDYFVLHPPAPEDGASSHEAYERFVEAYGEKPRELEVVLPTEAPATFFPQRYKCYGASGLKCIGDGVAADRIGAAMGKTDEEATEFFEISCPTPAECDFAERHGCRPVGSLYVLLPRVSLGGCFQIDVSGVNSIMNLNSSIDHIRAVCGRVSGILVPPSTGDGTYRSPIVLKRVPHKTQGGGRVSVHYPVTLDLRLGLDDLSRLGGPPGTPLSAIPSPTGAGTMSAQHARGVSGVLAPPQGTEPLVLSGADGEATERPPNAATDQRPSGRRSGPAAPLPPTTDPPFSAPRAAGPAAPAAPPTGAALPTNGDTEIAVEIDALFDALGVAPKLREAYRSNYAQVPETLLAVLRQKAAKKGIRTAPPGDATTR